MHIRVPSWLSGLRIWHCHWCGSVPGLGTSACHEHSQKKEREREKAKEKKDRKRGRREGRKVKEEKKKGNVHWIRQKTR